MSNLYGSGGLLIAGQTGVALQPPLWGKGPELRLWAERGLVHWEDARNNTYGSMNHVEAGFRVLALSEMVTRSSEDGDYADERQRLQRFISQMEDVIRQAKEQGSPLSPDAARHYRKSRPVSRIVPQECTLEF